MTTGSQNEGAHDQAAFQRFLAWLDEGAESGGQKYLEMHARLVAYFDRKNCLSPDSLADETMNRVARRLDEEGGIEGAPAQYCYIVARFVFLEYHRQAKPSRAVLTELPQPDRTPDEDGELMAHLERCMETLDTPERELILEYYTDEKRGKIERRRRLAQNLGLTMNAVSIRACRIRDRLEACVRNRSAGKTADTLSRFRLI